MSGITKEEVNGGGGGGGNLAVMQHDFKKSRVHHSLL